LSITPQEMARMDQMKREHGKQLPTDCELAKQKAGGFQRQAHFSQHRRKL